MDLKKESKANYMEKVLKTLIVLTIISATSLFIMHNASISKQKIDNGRLTFSMIVAKTLAGLGHSSKSANRFLKFHRTHPS